MKRESPIAYSHPMFCPPVPGSVCLLASFWNYRVGVLLKECWGTRFQLRRSILYYLEFQHSAFGDCVLSGISGSSSTGQIRGLSSWIFTFLLQFEYLLHFARLRFSCLTPCLAGAMAPLLINCRPRRLPLWDGMMFLSTEIIWNLIVFVFNFHGCPNLSMDSRALLVWKAIMFLDFEGCVMI